jgi:hypothetical protein
VTSAGPFRDPGQATTERALELRAEVGRLERELALVRVLRLDLEQQLHRQLGGQPGSVWAAPIGFAAGIALAIAGLIVLLAGG